jgi:hypothetical protein
MFGLWKEVRRILRKPKRLRQVMLEKMPNVIRAGNRAVSTKVKEWDGEYYKKTFENTVVGRKCFELEIEADRLFGNMPWKVPIKDKGPLWFTTPLYPQERRLDTTAAGLDQQTRVEIAGQAISVLFDIFFAGYAHRDFQSRNLFWIDKQLMLFDYECLERYPEEKRPPFPISYDITGQGLDSPFKTGRMCYTYDKHPGISLQSVLRIPVEQAIEEFHKELKNRLREACLTFATGQKRHTCRAGRIYSSFELPYFRILGLPEKPSTAKR